MGSGDYDVDMLRGVVVILSTTKCKENQCSVSQPGHTVSQVVSEGSGAAEALFRCELRTASWSICLRHVLRSCALDDFQEQKVFTVHTGAGACNGASCFQAPRLALDGHRVFWSLIFCGISITILHPHSQRCHASQIVEVDPCAPIT